MSFLGDSKTRSYPRAVDAVSLPELHQFPTKQRLRDSHLSDHPRMSSIGPSLRHPPGQPRGDFPSCSTHLRLRENPGRETKGTIASWKKIPHDGAMRRLIEKTGSEQELEGLGDCNVFGRRMPRNRSPDGAAIVTFNLPALFLRR